MPETESTVINTGPLIKLIAGYGGLSFLKKNIIVVIKRIFAHGNDY
jgi:hypothetical protein